MSAPGRPSLLGKRIPMSSAGDRFRTALLVIEEAAGAATEAESTYVLGHGSERLVYQAMESLEVLNFEHASDSDPGETAG